MLNFLKPKIKSSDPDDRIEAVKENEDAFENIPKKPLGYVFPTVEYSIKSTF